MIIGGLIGAAVGLGVSRFLFHRAGSFCKYPTLKCPMTYIFTLVLGTFGFIVGSAVN